jgi:hypothetical protein
VTDSISPIANSIQPRDNCAIPRFLKRIHLTAQPQQDSKANRELEQRNVEPLPRGSMRLPLPSKRNILAWYLPAGIAVIFLFYFLSIANSVTAVISQSNVAQFRDIAIALLTVEGQLLGFSVRASPFLKE